MAFGKGAKNDEALVYDSFEQLLEILADERRKTLKRHKKVVFHIFLYVSFIVALMFIIGLAHGNPGMLSGLFSSIGGIIAGTLVVSQTQRKAIQALTNFEDVRAVPYLIELLGCTDPATVAVANEQLPLLLVRMQASDASLLTKEHHTILNKVLQTNFLSKTGRKNLMTIPISKRFFRDLSDARHYVPRLEVAILQALQQIGDASSLPVVEELAEGNGQAKKCPELQQAAKDCLPFLRERAAHQQQTQTLLRASDGNITPVAMLLHPAMPAPSTTEAAELLRIAPDTEEPQVAELELPFNPQHYLQEEPPVDQQVSSGH